MNINEALKQGIIKRIKPGKLIGMHPGITGKISDMLSGDLTGISGNLSGIMGNLSGISGNLTGISGDLSDISGDLTGIEGELEPLPAPLNNSEEKA